MSKHLSVEQIEKARARREAMRALAKQISSMSPADRDALAARCPVVTVAGRGLSIFNQCLIARQLPSATIVGGFRQWIKEGRAVKKGEHGAAIWVPIGIPKLLPDEPSSSEVEGGSKRFILGTVFDVSQTREVESGVAA